MKKGLRKQKIERNRNIDQGVKSWMQKYKQMQTIGLEISKQDINISTLDEVNINEYASPLLGRDLDDMEKLIVLATMNESHE